MSQARLERLRELAKQEPDVSVWLERGLSRRQNGEAKTLDKALNLDRAEAFRERNKALQAAVDLLAKEFPEKSLWQLAGVLADEIKRFETRLRSTAKEDSPGWIIEISKALAQSCPQVRTQHKIHKVIR